PRRRSREVPRPHRRSPAPTPPPALRRRRVHATTPPAPRSLRPARHLARHPRAPPPSAVPSGLRELQVELAGIPRHLDAACRELEQVPPLPVQDPPLLELPDRRLDRVERQADPLR